MAKKQAKGVGFGTAAGALAAAGAAAAAGYYFYASSDAKKHRKIAAKWASDLKSDVVKQAKKVRAMEKADMAKVIDKATAAYESVRSVDQKELMRAAKELKNNWREIASEIGTGAQKAIVKGTKSAKKTAKSAVKSAKKTVKKVSKRVK